MKVATGKSLNKDCMHR